MWQGCTMSGELGQRMLAGREVKLLVSSIGERRGSGTESWV